MAIYAVRPDADMSDMTGRAGRAFRDGTCVRNGGNDGEAAVFVNTWHSLVTIRLANCAIVDQRSESILPRSRPRPYVRC